MHSLIIPLGAKADMTISLTEVDCVTSETYMLKLIDINGAEWESKGLIPVHNGCYQLGFIFVFTEKRV